MGLRGNRYRCGQCSHDGPFRTDHKDDYGETYYRCPRCGNINSAAGFNQSYLRSEIADR